MKPREESGGRDGVVSALMKYLLQPELGVVPDVSRVSFCFLSFSSILSRWEGP